MAPQPTNFDLPKTKGRYFIFYFLFFFFFTFYCTIMFPDLRRLICSLIYLFCFREIVFHGAKIKEYI